MAFFEEIKDDFHCSLKEQLSTHQAFDGQLYLSKLDALKNSVKQTNNNYIYDILILVGDINEIKRLTKVL